MATTSFVSESNPQAHFFGLLVRPNVAASNLSPLVRVRGLVISVSVFTRRSSLERYLFSTVFESYGWSSRRPVPRHDSPRDSRCSPVFKSPVLPAIREATPRPLAAELSFPAPPPPLAARPCLARKVGGDEARHGHREGWLGGGSPHPPCLSARVSLLLVSPQWSSLQPGLSSKTYRLYPQGWSRRRPRDSVPRNEGIRKGAPESVP